MAKKKLKDIVCPSPENLMVIGSSIVPYQYDIPRHLVEEMSAVFNFDKVADNLRNSKDKGAILRDYGFKVVKELVPLEKKHRDRTAEMIDMVAAKTGIYFPHVFQRYLEVFYNSVMPKNRYQVDVSTVREIKTEVSECTFKKHLTEAGISEDVCREFCRSVVEGIGRSLGMNLKFSIKHDPAGETCEHQFIAGE